MKRNILVPCYLLDDALKSPIGHGNKSWLSLFRVRDLEMREKNRETKAQTEIKWKQHKLPDWFSDRLFSSLSIIRTESICADTANKPEKGQPHKLCPI